MDEENFTICLTPKMVDKMVATLKSLRKIIKIKLLEFQETAGTLHHAATGIPVGRGLFTTIWSAMAKCKKNWITITPDLDQVPRYFKWLFKEISNKPIQVAQLVPCLLVLRVYSQACKHASGAVWVIPQHAEANKIIVWNYEFPPNIVLLLVQGTISINYLDMAGVILEWLAIEDIVPNITLANAGIQCEKISIVHWYQKLSAQYLCAGYLLRALALRQNN